MWGHTIHPACRPWDGPLLDRPDGFAGHPIEDVSKALFRKLRDRFDRSAVHRDVGEYRRCAEVIIPEPMVNGLEVPDTFPGSRVEADEAFAKKIVAWTLAAPVVARGRGDGQIDVPKLGPVIQARTSTTRQNRSNLVTFTARARFESPSGLVSLSLVVRSSV